MLSKIKSSLGYKISFLTLVVGLISIVAFSIFSYFYLENLQLKLLNKEMNAISTLFEASLSNNANLSKEYSKIEDIRKIHNPSGIINEFMDKIAKNSKYPIQLKLASQKPANLLFISNEKDDELINELKSSGKNSIAVIEPDVNNIPVYYYVKAIKVEKSCLSCHGQNPPSFMKKYYDNRGTGYKENDIIAAAIFSSPISYIKEENIKTIALFVGILAVLFLAIILVLNALLNKLVIKPIQDLTKSAEEISMGELSTEIKQTSTDEIGKLQASFERMRISLSKLMDLIDHDK